MMYKEKQPEIFMTTPSISTLNLLAYRCPDAAKYMRFAVNKLSEDKEMDGLIIESIEPSVARDLPAFLAHMHSDILLQKTDSRPVSDDDLNQWDGRFDEENYEGIENISRYHLIKKTG